MADDPHGHLDRHRYRCGEARLAPDDPPPGGRGAVLRGVTHPQEKNNAADSECPFNRRTGALMAGASRITTGVGILFYCYPRFFSGQGRAPQLPGEAADAVHSAEDDAREHQNDPGPVVRAGKRVVRAADRT